MKKLSPSIVYSTKPYLVQYDNWLTDDDINLILSKNLECVPARIRRPDGSLEVDSIRQCQTQKIDYGDDSYFDSLTQKVADFFKVKNLMRIESLYMMKYGPGDYFDWHTDISGKNETRRFASMIMYLNDDFEGGLTCFQRPDIQIPPKRGSALVYYYNFQEPMIHRGAPVTSGTKFILTAFIRTGEFSLAERKADNY